MNVKYFVCSDGDHPRKIHFDFEEAKGQWDEYIDAFDENGNWVQAWKYVDGEWTTDF